MRPSQQRTHMQTSHIPPRNLQRCYFECVSIPISISISTSFRTSLSLCVPTPVLVACCFGICRCVFCPCVRRLRPLTRSLPTSIAAPDSASAVPRSPLDTPGPNWVLKTDADKARLSTVGKPPSKYDDARCDFTGCPPDVPFIYYATPHRNRAFSYRRLLLTAQHDIEVSNVIPQACVCAV